MKRLVTMTAALALVACSGGTPGASANLGAAQPPSGGSLASSEGTLSASCAPRQGYSSTPDGTRVDDPTNGFAITLPHGWAEIDLASGDVVPAFSGLTMESATSAQVRATASAARNAGYLSMAVDLTPTSAGGQSPTPPLLLVARRAAVGATLDSIAASVTATARAGGVTGEITQTRLTLAGIGAVGLRYATVQQDLNGRQLPTVEHFYIALREDMAFELIFTEAAENAASEDAISDAIARSLEFHDGTAPSCSTAAQPTASAANGGSNAVGATSAGPSGLPDLFAGLPYRMDLPGWLGGGPARWDAQIRSLTAAGNAPDKLAILKGFDAPITGSRFFAIDAATDLAVYVDSGVLPQGLSDQDYLNAFEKVLIAAAVKDGQIVAQPVIDRLTSPVGGAASRIRYATRSVNRAGSEFNEARVGYVFRIGDVGYTLYFTFPVSDNRYDDVKHIVSTFRQT